MKLLLVEDDLALRAALGRIQGELIDGFADLRAWQRQLPDRGTYAALEDLYDDSYRGDAALVISDHTLDGQIELDNRLVQGRVEGLDTAVRLPLATSATEVSAKP